MNSLILRLLMLSLFLPTGILHAQSSAGAPNAIAYQGFLAQGGVPVNTPQTITVKLFDDSIGGNLVWDRTYAGVPVVGGVFNLLLENGDAEGINTDSLGAVSFGTPLWIQTTVGAETVGERTPLTSVPYALSLRGLRVLPSDDPDDAPNLIGGHNINAVSAGVVGATISGGGQTIGSENYANTAWSYGTIGGGWGNSAGSKSTVGGGSQNTAQGSSVTIGGGSGNTADGAYSTVGGGDNNRAAYWYSTVGGGADNMAGGGVFPEDFATVGGGKGNSATGFSSTIAGGNFNIAGGQSSSVPGGSNNSAGGNYSFAAGYRARVRDAIQTGDETGDQGTFIWSDRSETGGGDADYFISTGSNQFLVRAAGGVGIGTDSPSNQLSVAGNADFTGKVGIGTDNPVGMLHVAGPGFVQIDRTDNLNARLTLNASSGSEWRLVSTGTGDPQGSGHFQFRDESVGIDRFTITSGGRFGIGTVNPTFPLEVGTDATNGNKAHVTAGGTWTSTSSRTLKEGFEDIDARDILQKVSSLPVLKWRYTGSNEGEHIGPMAEDFSAAFGLGHTDKAITMVDADGIALAAIQGLYEFVQEKEQENQELRDRIDEQDSRLATLERLFMSIDGSRIGGK